VQPGVQLIELKLGNAVETCYSYILEASSEEVGFSDTNVKQICIFISPETGSQKQTQIKKNKYTARENNATPAATLRIHIAIGIV